MSDNTNKIILIGILISLIIIAFKPVPSFHSPDPVHFPSSFEVYNGEKVVQIGENRIAIVDTDFISGMRGEIIVLEFNEEKSSFDVIGRYNYIDDFFRNP
jgi:hypothetical protein